MNPDGRLHYFCEACWSSVEHGPELSTGGATPGGKVKLRPPVGKVCCFCESDATHRARSHVDAPCPAGHIPPERLETIFGRVEADAKQTAEALFPPHDDDGDDG